MREDRDKDGVVCSAILGGGMGVMWTGAEHVCATGYKLQEWLPLLPHVH